MTRIGRTRDDFPAALKRVLGERVAYTCSNPDCQRVTIGPHSSHDQALRLGRAAHVCAAAPGGPRYDATQSSDERASISNGIWLCAICADIVDKDAIRFPADTLRAWKARAERSILELLERGLASAAHTQKASAASSIDRLEAERLLHEAFDMIAGGAQTSRLTWRDRDPDVLERVRRLIADATILDSDAKRLPILLALYYLAANFPDKALEEISKVPADLCTVEHEQLRAECLYFSGQKDAARQILEQLASDASSPASVHYNLGYALLAADERNRATAAFQRALDRDDRYVEAWEMLGSMAYDRQDLSSATYYASKAYAIDPRDANAARNYATVLLDTGHVENALLIMRDAYKVHPTNGDVAGVLGRALAQHGELEEAAEMLRRCTNSETQNPIALRNLGNVLVLQGRVGEAMSAFERAADLGHPDADDLRKIVEIAKQHLGPE